MSLLAPGRDDRIEEIFPEISAFVYDVAGILLPDSKIGLVRSRLQRRLRETGHPDFPTWFEWMKASGGEEQVRMIDLITTNKTHFFREGSHFDFLRSALGTPPMDGGQLRLWSAGCSSGEEPYTLSAVLQDAVGRGSGYRILATDLSTRVLDAARVGEYPASQAREVPDGLRRILFEPGSEKGMLRVPDAVRRPVSFGRLNLLEPWPMRLGFHAIFCRNVMIYFDHETRSELVRRFTAQLVPGGYLFVGHSESLNGLDHDLRYVRPAVYRR